MWARCLAVFLLAAACGCARWPRRGFSDDFSYPAGACVPDGGSIGPWSVVSTGFGCVKATGDGRRRWLQAGTSPSVSRRETHAFLITGPRVSGAFTLTVRVRTDEQLRRGPANAWESAWLVWSYRDRKHFYYFAAKPSGWELGKRDPAFRGGQRFLADGKIPAFPLGEWATVRISHDGRRIRARVNGRLVADFVDVQRPYDSGRIGLYGEDCAARFDDVSVVLGEEQLESGDREHDGEKALDRRVGQAGTAEIRAREASGQGGRGEASRDAREGARLD